MSYTHVSEFTRMKVCRHGPMLYNVNDEYIGRSLDHYGEYSQGEIDLFREVLRPGDAAVDAGANIGTHSVAMARIVGESGAVFAFEPQRLVFQTLCANVALNDLINVWTYHAALSDRAGQIRVPTWDPRQRGNFGAFDLAQANAGDPVPVIALDQLGLPKCRLLKVDVEGFELSVLSGAVQTIQRLEPILYVENDRPQQSAPLIAFIRSLNYTLYWHKPPMFNPDNFFKNSDNIFPDVFSFNMLCLPQGSDIRVADLKSAEITKHPI